MRIRLEIEPKIEAIDFPYDTESYEARLKKAKAKTKHADAILIEPPNSTICL